ncbi:MAG: outer membrane protein assembly factor BamB [Kiritimatiellia bacterium]|jgi:outer membrane protein assembly factor BamB
MYRLLTILILLSSLSLQAEDWPFYRGPQNTGSSSESDWNPEWPEGQPPIAWKKELGIGASSFTIVGDQVFTMGNQKDHDVVWCLNAKDGSEIWAARYPVKFEKRMYEGGTSATPTIDGNHVYAFSYDGQLVCLNKADGKEIWRKHMLKDYGGKLSQWKYAGSPLVQGDRLFLDIGGKGNSTIALNKNTGEKIWGSGKESAGYSTIVPFKNAGQDTLLVFKGQSLNALNPVDGQERWSVKWKTSYDVNASSPIPLDGQILVTSGYKGGRAVLFDVTGSKPKQHWRNDDIKTKMSSAVVADGCVYAVTEAGAKLVCADMKTGKTLWTEKGTGQFGTLTHAGNTLIVLTESGELWTVKPDRERFSLISRGKVLEGRCWVTPAMANGRIYCRNNRGTAVCVAVDK